MILNTTEADNATYYGQGIGRVSAKFTGDFVRTNMKIDAVAMRDSRLFLPIDTYVEAGEAAFIRFVKPNERGDSTKIKTLNSDYLKGIQLDFDLGISREAVVQMIIDKRAGDYVTGRGIGDINISYDRTGKFSMYGQYEIEQGEYLFTLFNVFNKPFKVAKGGTITWYGDPYQAQINLTATYDETTPVATLIQSELLAQQNSAVSNLARTPTNVDLDLKLTGNLFKPDIAFDINFPDLTGELKSIVDNKMRILRSDPNELNRQVFGIVVVGTFLPDNSGGFISNSDYFATAVNSVTQVLSGQLSTYLSTFAQDLLGDKVSNIDFYIAYNDIRSGSLSSTEIINAGREVQSRLRFSLKDDRIHVQVGSQVGYSNLAGATNDSFVGGDVVVEFDLNESKQWRLKAYSKFEPTIIGGGGLQQRYGGGITFSKDYDSFGHMMTGLNNLTKKLKTKS